MGRPSADPSSGGPTPAPWLAASLIRRGLGLTFPQPQAGQVEVRRLPAFARLPEPGSRVDPAALGPLEPSVGPGLAVDVRPDAGGCAYVAVEVDGADGVAGAGVAVADHPPVEGLRQEDGRLRWDWPDGCTEVLVLVRADAPPTGPGDPESSARKTTNTRHDLEGGVPLPPVPAHVAVLACRRAGVTLLVSVVPARLALPAP